ncbi:MAG: hypothetical protein K6F09_00485 [Clostridiales bacterium]|nr:hypothetical protein [Clostridiales bacterium]
MDLNGKVSVTEDVTLISLNDSPANIDVIAGIFERIAEAGIDVDMISQTPPNGRHSSLSFTVSGEDFGGILEIAAKFREVNPDIKISVSSGNCKIAVFSDSMKGTPGVAAKVFKAAANANADIRMITTSEVDISMLVVKADLENTLAEIGKLLK